MIYNQLLPNYSVTHRASRVDPVSPHLDDERGVARLRRMRDFRVPARRPPSLRHFAAAVVITNTPVQTPPPSTPRPPSPDRTITVFFTAPVHSHALPRASSESNTSGSEKRGRGRRPTTDRPMQWSARSPVSTRRRRRRRRTSTERQTHGFGRQVVRAERHREIHGSSGSSQSHRPAPSASTAVPIRLGASRAGRRARGPPALPSNAFKPGAGRAGSLASAPATMRARPPSAIDPRARLAVNSSHRRSRQPRAAIRKRRRRRSQVQRCHALCSRT